MARKPPSSSAVGRFLRLGGLMGRVGASVAAERAVDFAFSPPGQEARRTENLVRNARRVVATLGEMKGAVMKVGQMLSLHESVLPPEVAEVLQLLQKEAPRVPDEVMRYEVEGSLGAGVGELFAEFEREAFAAASIGQVHRARLHDGRWVAVKVQYPLIHEIVAADLKNLKRLLQALFGLVFDVDFEPIWGELRDRLLEELDYRHEAENMRQMARLHDGLPEISIPEVVAELSTERVLTMTLVEGIPPNEACSDRHPRELKDRWGQVLLEFQLRGLFEHRLLHADPNLANFAFREDGGVVVYDFGCLKRIPPALAEGYAALVRAVLDERREDVPGILRDLGVYKKGHVALPRAVIDPYLDLFAEMFRASPPYAFGEDEDLYAKILELGSANWSQSTDMRFPEDIIFIDRSLAGHFGNLTRLGAKGPWRDLLARYARPAPEIRDREAG
ncbi:MAG: AarF/ABC1/UbiB kinase family protein [Acidobacteriota bacterium]|nr:AarF/ABC1/UbiB kinase family protein [Acidobacteriota bacterium]MDH3523191.1 AarF/ABC1/UbiB kinase family protein [Acidobacteriota bacterium]